MPAGRPPAYDTPEEMQVKIDEYFKSPPTKDVLIGENLRPVPCLTITGLCLQLGCADRSSFYKYEDKEEFRHTIKTARLRIENDYEMGLKLGNNNSGNIFALKNFGWKDKQEVESTNKHEHTIKDLDRLSDEELARIATGSS